MFVQHSNLTGPPKFYLAALRVAKLLTFAILEKNVVCLTLVMTKRVVVFSLLVKTPPELVFLTPEPSM